MELRTVDSVVAALLGTIALLATASLLVGAGAAGADPESYERVHHMSAEAYASRSYLMAGLFGAGLAVSVLTFVDRDRRRLWRALVYVGAVALVLRFGYGCWGWAASGFDH
ncbi:MAG TPA: hypothetical protein VF576_03310 [Rubricoccaceae bacterium]